MLKEAIEDEDKGVAYYENLAMFIDTANIDNRVFQMSRKMIHQMVDEMTSDERQHAARLSLLFQTLSCEV